MISFKAYILTWIVWFQFKGSFQTAQGFHARIKRERKNRAQNQQPPAHVRKQCVVAERQERGYTVFDFSPKSEPIRARILFIAGGAFVFDPAPVHWEFAAMLSNRLQAVVTMPLYPLGPEHNLLEVYEFLQPIHDDMAASHDETPFWVMGDSAGGTIAIVLSQHAVKVQRPVASRLVLLTPCVDATMSNPEVRAAAASDPWMDVPGIEEIPRMICPELNVRDPRISPLYGDYDGLPPMLVFAAGRDLLSPDTRRFVTAAKERGREVVLVEGEGMLHVWPILPIPEAAVAMDRIVRFVEDGA